MRRIDLFPIYQSPLDAKPGIPEKAPKRKDEPDFPDPFQEPAPFRPEPITIPETAPQPLTVPAQPVPALPIRR